MLPPFSTASRRGGRFRHISTGPVGLAIVLLMGGFCLLAGSMILTMREQIWSDTTRTSRNLLHAETAGIDRVLTIYDASLRDAAADAQNPLLAAAPAALRRLAVTDGVEETPDLGPIRVLDPAGTVLLDAAASVPAPADAAERAALAAAAGAAGGSAAVSLPFRTARGGWAVTLSRRIDAADGRFAGIAIGTIDLDLFQAQFRKLDLGPHDVVTLFRDDGTILAHIPGDPMVGRSIAGSEVLRHFHDGSAGSFVAPAATDGVVRVFSFQHVRPWPVFLDVGLSAQDLYRPWYIRTAILGVLMATMVAAALVLLRLIKRDLVARRLTEENLHASEHRYRLLAESASDVIVRVDRQTIRTYVSPSCAQFGYEPGELVGMVSSSWIHPEDLPVARETFFRTIDEQVDGIVHYRLRRKTGEYAWVESRLSPIQQGGYLAVIRNIDGEKREDLAREAASRDAATASVARDELTGLLNRSGFADALQTGWAAAGAGGRTLSLVLVDADHFGWFLDRYGRERAEGLLRAIGQIVATVAGEHAGTVARLAGDRFAVLLPSADLGATIEVAQLIRIGVWNAAIDHVGCPEGRVTVSAGGATAAPGKPASSPDALMQAASDALNRVRTGGRNQVQVLALA